MTNYDKITKNSILAFFSQSMDSVPLLKQILEWVSGIVKAYLATWVLRRGGWVMFFLLNQPTLIEDHK